MDGSGIDFVEADFGQESAAGGAHEMPNTEENWRKWSEQTVRSPFMPIVVCLVVFLAIMMFPHILEFAMERSLEDSARQAAQTPAPQQAESYTQGGAPAQADRTGMPAAPDPRFGAPARR